MNWQFLHDYRRVSRVIKQVVLINFFIQLVNTAFAMLRNYFLLERGYVDFEIANITSYNYIGVMLVALPIGLWIKGRNILPLYKIGVCFIPILAFLEIYAIDHHYTAMLKTVLLAWGVCWSLIVSTSAPFVVLNEKKELHPEGLSLLALTWSVAFIISGLAGNLFKSIFTQLHDEKYFLYLMAFCTLPVYYVAFKLRTEEKKSEKVSIFRAHKEYDWLKIGKALVPTTFIAVGAGLTIQFINLFFESSHHTSSKTFALMSSTTYILVTLLLVFIPKIRKNYGYDFAVTFIQLLAVAALIGMALTDWFAGSETAFIIAAFFFIIRQPLMNAAGPATSELTMNFVGEKNQELISSIQASIWSGSWFLSAKIFEVLRAHQLRYGYILLITAGMYLIAIYLYHRLIKLYERQTA